MGKAVKLANLPNAPVFSASRTTSQSLSSGAWNKVQCATEEFDTASAYDPTTNFRFQPQSATQVIAAIFKNGSLHKYGQPSSAAAPSEVGSVVSGLVHLNGSTDYVELHAYVAGSTPNLAGNAALNNFQGALVREA